MHACVWATHKSVNKNKNPVYAHGPLHTMIHSSVTYISFCDLSFLSQHSTVWWQIQRGWNATRLNHLLSVSDHLFKLSFFVAFLLDQQNKWDLTSGTKKLCKINNNSSSGSKILEKHGKHVGIVYKKKNFRELIMQLCWIKSN